MVGQTKTLAKVTFSPNLVQQAKIARNGMLGDFTIQYDVNRELSVGEVQVCWRMLENVYHLISGCLFLEMICSPAFLPALLGGCSPQLNSIRLVTVPNYNSTRKRDSWLFFTLINVAALIKCCSIKIQILCSYLWWLQSCLATEILALDCGHKLPVTGWCPFPINKRIPSPFVSLHIANSWPILVSSYENSKISPFGEARKSQGTITVRYLKCIQRQNSGADKVRDRSRIKYIHRYVVLKIWLQ